MREQIAVQHILQKKYEEMRQRNQAFSRRAFAKKLGVSPGAMSDLFNGRRYVSQMLASRLADKLLLDPQERSKLFSAFDSKKNNDTSTEEIEITDPNYLQLSADQFRIIGDWYHFAILTLMRTDGFQSNPKWIANRLGISEAVAIQAIERLKRIELVKQDKTGKLTRSVSRYRTTDDVTNVSVQKAHLEYLENSKQAIQTVPVAERDFTSIMMSIDPAKIPKAKEKIRKFQDRLNAFLESDVKSEVYQMCIQLFPLTKSQSGKP